MIPVPTEVFAAAGVRPVCGFDFYYREGDAAYGVCVRTDGTLPQVMNLIEAGKVGEALQQQLFGSPARHIARLYL